MAEKYKVKKVRTGIEKGKWGIYKGRTLMLAFKDKPSAIRDCNRRNDKEAG